MPTNRVDDRHRMTRREALRLAAFLPAGVLLANCTREEAPLIESIDDDTSSRSLTARVMQDLLDRRAEAQLRGDEEQYLAGLDPSNDEMVGREQMTFANIQQFAPDDVRFVLGSTARSGLGIGPVQPTDTFRVAPVIKVVKLAADAGPDGVLGAGESFEYVVTRQDDAWIVSNIVPLTARELKRREKGGGDPGEPLLGQGVLPANAPWNHDPLTVIRAGNVWLAADDSVTDLERYAAEAEAQAREVVAIWGDRPKYPGNVFFFTRRKKAMRRWFDFGQADVTGFREGYATAVSGVRANGEIYSGQPVGSRIVMYLSGVEQFGWSPRDTMRHELVHAVTNRAEGTGDVSARPASWAVEGFALFIQIRGDSSVERDERALAASGFTGSLPRTKGFQRGSDVSSKYALGYTVFSFIEQANDLDTAIAFFEEVIKYTDDVFDVGEAFADTPAFDGICQQVLGMTSVEFLEQWASYVRAGG
jgi:hypothetical protein